MSASNHHESSVSTTDETVASPFDRVGASAARHERLLWGVVVAALVADVLLTAIGLGRGLTEGNPAMRVAMGTGGLGALVFAKLCAVALGVAVRLWQPDFAGIVPLGIAIPWLAAAAVNAATIA